MGRHSTFLARRFNIKKPSIPLKLVHKFNVIPTKIPIGF